MANVPDEMTDNCSRHRSHDYRNGIYEHWH